MGIKKGSLDFATEYLVAIIQLGAAGLSGSNAMQFCKNVLEKFAQNSEEAKGVAARLGEKLVVPTEEKKRPSEVTTQSDGASDSEASPSPAKKLGRGGSFRARASSAAKNGLKGLFGSSSKLDEGMKNTDKLALKGTMLVELNKRLALHELKLKEAITAKGVAEQAVKDVLGEKPKDGVTETSTEYTDWYGKRLVAGTELTTAKENVLNLEEAIRGDETSIKSNLAEQAVLEKAVIEDAIRVAPNGSVEKRTEQVKLAEFELNVATEKNDTAVANVTTLEEKLRDTTTESTEAQNKFTALTRMHAMIVANTNDLDAAKSAANRADVEGNGKERLEKLKAAGQLESKGKELLRDLRQLVPEAKDSATTVANAEEELATTRTNAEQLQKELELARKEVLATLKEKTTAQTEVTQAGRQRLHRQKVGLTWPKQPQ